MRGPGIADLAPESFGQNSGNPMSLFNNHVLTLVGGKWYDPSYGTFYVGANEQVAAMDMQKKAIDGFYFAKDLSEVDVGVDLNGSGRMDQASDMKVRTFIIGKNPPNKGDLRFAVIYD